MSDSASTSVDVSVLIVFRNEEQHIQHCIASIEAQFEPGDSWELILVDGCSTDRSRELVEAHFQGRNDVRWQLINNPKKTLATGWNLGIQAASGTFVIRPDAHAALHSGYIAGARKVMAEKPELAAVGGILHTIGKGFWGRIIARALSARVGVGNSGFRTGAPSGYADTAVYGLYRRAVYADIGLFDETLVRHQDTELHGRVLAAGWKFWLQNTIAADYYCRDTMPRLLTQMYRIGYYLPDLMGQRGGLRLRHLAPAGFFGTCLLLTLLACWFAPAAYLLLGLLTLYVGAIFVTALFATKDGLSMLLLLAVIPWMHLAYAWGTARGLLRQLFAKSAPANQTSP